MIGWRARIGILVPPGNPTVELETVELVPKGVSVHFTRMSASGPAGSHVGQEERNLSQIQSVDSCAELLKMVFPSVVALAHTATSYTLGKTAEANLVFDIEQKFGFKFITAFGSAIAAFKELNIKKIGYATPYNYDTTMKGKQHFEAHDIDVLKAESLEGVVNIYNETPERAYTVGRAACHNDVDAIFLSGVGMPTLPALQQLENDTGKIVLSATGCMMWHALRVSGVTESLPGYGRLFSEH